MNNVSDKSQGERIKQRANELGVLDIALDGATFKGALDAYEKTLDIIAKHKEILDRNAGESR
jgi:hypothetical protein